MNRSWHYGTFARSHKLACYHCNTCALVYRRNFKIPWGMILSLGLVIPNPESQEVLRSRLIDTSVLIYYCNALPLTWRHNVTKRAIAALDKVRDCRSKQDPTGSPFWYWARIRRPGCEPFRRCPRVAPRRYHHSRMCQNHSVQMGNT